MRTMLRRTGLALAAILATAGLAACTTSSTTPDTTTATSPAASRDEATFPAPRGDLTIASEFGTIRVHRHQAPTVIVQRRLAHVGVNVGRPDWTLQGNTLDLGTGCGVGYVGFCEPSYDITVPASTKVHLKDKSEQG